MLIVKFVRNIQPNFTLLGQGRECKINKFTKTKTMENDNHIHNKTITMKKITRAIQFRIHSIRLFTMYMGRATSIVFLFFFLIDSFTFNRILIFFKHSVLFCMRVVFDATLNVMNVR